MVAVIVKVDTPVAVAVPESTPAEDRLMPAGSVPAVTANVDAGEPDAVTLNVPKLPAVNVVDAALVMVGAELRLIVKLADTGVVTVGRAPPQVPSASTSTDVLKVLMTYALAVAEPVGISVNVASS